MYEIQTHYNLFHFNCFKGAPAKPPPFSSISSKTGQLKPVFLYVISLQSEGINRPIFQALSQRHTSDFICYIMRYWRHYENNKRNPHEIIMDNSKAEILAAIQAYTSFNTAIEYFDACFDNIFNDANITMGCFVRLDRSHIVKQIHDMDIFDNIDYRSKKLFQRILGYLISASDIQVVEKILKHLFMLILNKYEHIEPVTEARMFLKKISDDHSIENIAESLNLEFGERQEHDFIQEESKFKNWIKSIVNDIREKFVNESLNNSAISDEDSEYIENLYYVPDKNNRFVNSLINFLSLLPMWSNIMMGFFDSQNSVATSSPTEATFKNIKHVIFKNELGLRIDLFVEKYRQF